MALDIRIRDAFSSDALTYNKVRPAYPDYIVKEIIEYADLPADGKILDAGCGSGQATIPIARLGYQITGLDLSLGLLMIAWLKSLCLPNLKFKKGTFEDAKFPDNYYDLIISATSFHWFDPNIAYNKAGRLLKNKGTLALLWGCTFKEESNPLIDKVNKLFGKYCPDYKPINWENFIQEPIDNIAKTNMFEPVTLKSYNKEYLEYTKKRYMMLLSTHAWVKKATNYNRQQFFEALANLLEKEQEPLTIPNPLFCIITKRKK